MDEKPFTDGEPQVEVQGQALEEADGGASCLWQGPPEPCAIVIFGASGDLTGRKLVPALCNLFVSGGLPIRFLILGAAHLYEADLRGFFAGRPPVFDLVLLGLGADGHVASLFPASPALTEAWAVATTPPPGVEPAVARVSLTLPVINAGRQVVFLVTGAAKAPIVARALGRAGQGTPDLPASLPALRVRPAAGEPLWLLDAQVPGLPGRVGRRCGPLGPCPFPGRGRGGRGEARGLSRPPRQDQEIAASPDGSSQ